MKNIIFTVFFTLILAGFSAFSQTSQLITHVDTLQSGDVIVTLTDSQGNIINKGLAKPGFVLQNDTTDIVFPTGGTDENPSDVFVDNINLPGSDGGFLPQDVVFNSHNGNYYIYGFRKIMVCDANMQAIKTIDISDVDGFSTFYSDYHERRIFVHPTQNMVYGMTINGVLFSIDQDYNLLPLTDPIGDYLIERSSMVYNLMSGAIFYYFCLIDENGSYYTKIYKYTLTDGILTSTIVQDVVSYDIDVLSNILENKILVSTNQGIKVLNNNLQWIDTLFFNRKFDHIAVMSNRIFAHQTNPSNKILVLNSAGDSVQDIQISNTNVRFMLPNETYAKLYISCYSASNSAITIVMNSGRQWVIQDRAHDNIFGLTENSSQIIGCGKDSVIFINKQTNVQTSIPSTSIGQLYRVAPAASTNIAIAAQPLNGNMLKISSSSTQVLETGGNVSGVCRKGDKIYMAINKFNNRGYILILNAYSGEIVGKVEPTFTFNPVDVFCLDDENVVNNRIYSVYMKQSGDSLVNRLMFFDCNNPSVITDQRKDYVDGMLEYLVSPNGSVFIGERSDKCSTGCKIYFFNWDLEDKGPKEFASVGGCVTEFDFIKDLNYFVYTSPCNLNIYFFRDRTDTIEYLDSCNGAHFSTFGYNKYEGNGYSFCNASSSSDLYWIDMEDFGKTHIEDNYPFKNVNEIFYNPNDSLVYGISSDTMYKIGDQTLQGTYILDIPFTVNTQFHRDDDYIFDEKRNKLCLAVTDNSGYVNSNKIIIADLSNEEEQFTYFPGLTYQKSILVQYPIKAYGMIGKSLTYYPEKQNFFCGQMYFSNSSLVTTFTHSRTLTGDWNWISFPCMPRLGNNGYDSQTILETIDPLEDYLELDTQSGGSNKQLSFENLVWNIDDIPTLISTQGYKYYTDPTGNQSLTVTGVVLDPATPIQLSSSYENWIGYFLEEPLAPEDAFVGVWDKLTRISTHDWTMVKIFGQWFGSKKISPVNYGDGLIVTVSEDCELIWNYISTPAENYTYPMTAYYSYDEKAEYLPFYFEMDSMFDVREIGLIVNDSCVGAAVVEPGDSIVEVNAYLTGTQSGLPIEVETWSGFKSAKLSPDRYSVVDPATRKRISRKVYTGEHKAYYILSFKSGETADENPVALLQPPSPNPFSSATQLSFVLNRQAKVSLTVHDLQGNTVKTLLRGSYPEGLYDAGWTGTDASGKQAGNGIYVIRLTVDEKIIKNEKVVLIK